MKFSKGKQIIAVLVATGLALGALQLKQRYIDYEPPPARQEISFPDRIEQVSSSVVHIKNETQGWQGSGVCIWPGIIMTARHVIEGGEEFTITTLTLCEKNPNGWLVAQFKATQAISSKEYDLGFIRVPQGINVSLPPVRLGSIQDCRLGQQVFTIGSPYGELNFNSVTLGIISGKSRDFDEWAEKYGYPKYGWSVTFTTDAAGHPGNSGCPIFTMDGKMRGVLVGGLSPVLIYCIPIDLIMMDLSLISAMFTMDNYEIEEADEMEKWRICYSQKHSRE